MGVLGRWVGAVVVLAILAIAANVVRGVWVNVVPSLKSEDGEHSVLDGLTGKMAVDQYLSVQEKSPTFNFPAIRTAVMMYYANHGRYPTSLEEVARDGTLSRDAMRDQFGNPFELSINGNRMKLQSAGRDRIRGTTEDLEFVLNL